MARPDFTDLQSFVMEKWLSDVIPTLEEYIKIPNLSPFFDKDILTNGHAEKAMKLLHEWVMKQEVAGMTVRLEQEPERTALMLIDIAATHPEDSSNTGTVLMYGHMDKQPPFEGWKEGLGPYTPVVKDGVLYGRGGADDGYSTFCAVLSILGLQRFNIPHARIVILIEGSEESGSIDLPFYIEKFSYEIGSPNLIVCLDSGCGNYDQLWLTSSLRGTIGGTLSVDVLTEGVHSGTSSGVVPDSFRIMRMLLSRIEDEATGLIKLKELNTALSVRRMNQVKEAAATLGLEGMRDIFPFVMGCKPNTDYPVQLALNRWWMPQLTVIGANGFPSCDVAGNVLRPQSKLSLSMRLPPTIDAKEAQKVLAEALTKDPPYGAKVEFVSEKAASGWAAPETAMWLDSSLQHASKTLFDKPALFEGEGGSIPFMAMLGKMFPKAQFCVTGVLGPGSNAHGPNEALQIDFSGKVCIACSMLLADHCRTEVEKLINSEGSPAGSFDPDELQREFKRQKNGEKM